MVTNSYSSKQIKKVNEQWAKRKPRKARSRKRSTPKFYRCSLTELGDILKS